MSERIQIGKDEYIYCDVPLAIGTYQCMYDSSEECFNDIRNNILVDCIDRNYNVNEIKRVLNHYEIALNNANGKWENMY